MYSSLNVVRVIKPRRMRLAVHVARMGRIKVYTGFGGENFRERDDLEDPCVDGGNMKKDLQEVGCESMDWIVLAQDRER